MAYTIAIAGKGGSGKTTLASLVVYHLIRLKRIPILAVDADPNSNLNLGLGFKFDQTIADLREETLRQTPQGISKTEFLNLRLQESIIEGDKVDLLVMGRPEGTGCYCAVNNLLREHLSKISKNYSYVVIDNEAGMEHLSRRTTDDVDTLILVSEPSVVGARSCALAFETAKASHLKIKNIFFILNKVKDNVTPAVKFELKKLRVSCLGEISYDETVLKASESGMSLLDLREDSLGILAVKSMMEKIGIG